MRQRVEGFGLERAHRKGTENLSAYEHVLRGRADYDRMTAVDDEAAQRNFRNAIRLDPGYALAHAYLARVHMDVFLFAWAKNPEVALSRALDLAQKAVALDGSDSFAHAALGSAHLYLRQHRRAETAFDKAVALNPNDTDTLLLRGFLSEALGQADDCLAWIERAKRLNPFPPDWYLWELARGYFLGRRYEDVLATCDEIKSPPYEIFGLAAASLGWMGRKRAAEALARFREAARAEMAAYPGENADGWRRYWSNAYPYRDPADLDHLFEGLRRAGLAV